MPSKISQSITSSSLSKWLRHCACCGSSFPPIEWLCRSCMARLQSYYLQPKYMIRLQSSFRHGRLIDWDDSNDQFIRSLIQSLKGDIYSPLFMLLAKEFYFRICQLTGVLRDQPFILVPCPARKKYPKIFYSLKIFKNLDQMQSVDHGFFWTQCISQTARWPLISALEQPDLIKPQKKKDKLTRKRIHFTRKDSIAFPPNYRVVFVDDIVTSGATAQAAYKALGKPQPFMVWSIFWRKNNFIKVS